jgi:hypothetical protein
LINEDVGAKLVIDCGYSELSGRQPLQSRCNIARPNSPSRTILEFDNVTLVVLFNSHEPSPRRTSASPMKGFPGGIRSIMLKV